MKWNFIWRAVAGFILMTIGWANIENDRTLGDYFAQVTFGIGVALAFSSMLILYKNK